MTQPRWDPTSKSFKFPFIIAHAILPALALWGKQVSTLWAGACTAEDRVPACDAGAQLGGAGVRAGLSAALHCQELLGTHAGRPAVQAHAAGAYCYSCTSLPCTPMHSPVPTRKARFYFDTDVAPSG